MQAGTGPRLASELKDPDWCKLMEHYDFGAVHCTEYTGATPWRWSS